MTANGHKTEDLSAPLTPADCDLQDFQFMPLDVGRLRDSDIAAISTGDEFRCAVLLWCASWHQVPAASLPDDDKVLAQYAGFGRVVKEWMKVRAGALRGWVKCSDGRLYHSVVAEKANEAWAGRVKYREKKEAERQRKAEERRLKKLQDEANQSAAEEALQRGGNGQDNNGMSEGQTGNVQRTDPQSPPENALRGTVDSGQGQWTVDSGQLTPQADTSSSQPVPVAPEAQPGARPEPERPEQNLPLERHVQIALLLRAQGVQATSQNPIVCVTWAQNPKVTDEVLNVAITKAKAAKPGETIPVKYLLPIVEQELVRQSEPPPEAKPREDNSWAASDSGITAKARELKIRVLPMHSYADVKRMCFDEIRKRKGA